MSPIEIIDVQCEIIRLQSELIGKLAQHAGQIDALGEELLRSNELKRRIEAKP